MNDEQNQIPEPPTPLPLAIDEGLDLLQQAFHEASKDGRTLLAAKIAGGMSRISFLNGQAADNRAQLVELRARFEASEQDRLRLKAVIGDAVTARREANEATPPPGAEASPAG